MIIGTALGWGDWATIALAVVLAFFFGYSLTMVPLLRGGLALGAAIPVALAADTVSITIMEIVDNAIMLLIPGAMEAGLDESCSSGAASPFALARRRRRRLPREPLADRARPRPRGRARLPLTTRLESRGCGCSSPRRRAPGTSVRSIPLIDACRAERARDARRRPADAQGPRLRVHGGSRRRPTRSSGRCGARCRAAAGAGRRRRRRHHLRPPERRRDAPEARRGARAAGGPTSSSARPPSSPRRSRPSGTGFGTSASRPRSRIVEHGALGHRRAGDRRAARGRLGPHRRVAVPDLLPGVGRSRAVRGDARSGMPAAEAEPDALPDWWPGVDGPLVYVSFGSVAATVPPAAQVYGRALEAVADLPVRVLLTTGGNESSWATCRRTSASSGGSTSRRCSATPPRSSGTAGRGRR